jgi:lysylphosphatidylglycerol synthetase-like protein (DUF2156 family)
MSNQYEPPKSHFTDRADDLPPHGTDGLAMTALVSGILSIIFALSCGILTLPLSLSRRLAWAQRGLSQPMAAWRLPDSFAAASDCSLT